MISLDHMYALAELPALISRERTVTYGEYAKIVGHTLSNLHRLGVKPLDRVALLGHNSPDYILSLIALIQAKAIACPLSTRLPQQAVSNCLDQIHCRFVIAFGETQSTNLPSGVTGISADELLMPSTLSKTNRIMNSMEQPATILFTSGSSAEPKAVLLSLGNHYYSAVGSNRNLPFAPGDHWLLSLPLYHVGGLGIVFRALFGGGAVALPDQGEDTIQAALHMPVTHMSLVPTQLGRLLQREKALNSVAPHLKAILLGGGPVPSNLITTAIERRLPLFTSYGLTEMTSQVTTTTASDSTEKLTTSGRLLAHRKLKISDHGEIMVKGETLFTGYVTGHEIAADLDEGGWFATGDLGFLDEEGYLRVVGRKDSMFVSGGENIHPEEIEAVLRQAGGVDDVIVVSVEDDEFGARPVAFVQMAKGRRLDESSLVTFLEKKLNSVKIPDSFFPWPEKESIFNFKPSRAQLAERARVLKQDR